METGLDWWDGTSRANLVVTRHGVIKKVIVIN